MYGQLGLFINGEWRRARDGGSAPVRSPVTEEVMGEVPLATAADTEEAIASAVEGFRAWRTKQAFERADALHLVADEMIRRRPEAARMISAETGKPIAQSEREWNLSIDQFRWFAEEARRIYGRVIESRVPNGRFEVTHEPVGIAAAFTAWNFPAALIARKVAPALAAGCSVIVRPSSQTPGVAMVMFDCLRAGKLPAGAANLVVGATATTHQPIMASPLVRKVSLTGSTRVGQMIRDAAQTMKKVSMELGGNAPLIVYDDADLELALSVGLRLHHQPEARPAHRRGTQGGHGRDQQLRARRRGSALRRHEVLGHGSGRRHRRHRRLPRHQARADRLLAGALVIKNKLKALWAEGRPTLNGADASVRRFRELASRAQGTRTERAGGY
jgi:succinate-semialdehyde dehydrogenase / glutarate-semialdehyde dehydrogenase